MTDLFEEVKRTYLLDQEKARAEARISKTIAEDTVWGIDQHRDYLTSGTKSDKCMNYPILQRKVVCNHAFLGLSPVATKILILAYSETFWTPPTTDKRRVNKHVPFEPGQPKSFVLPYNRVCAAGISSHGAIKRGFDELIALGFLDVESAQLGSAKIYRISERYLLLTEKDVARIKKKLKKKPLRLV